MIDISMMLDFYFTKYLFMASVFVGLCRIVRKLMRGT